MAKSNKPIIWGTFAAGGEVVSLITPVIIVLILFAAIGRPPSALGYEQLHAFAAWWFGKLVIFGIVFLSLWSQAHRLRITCFDFGLRADGLVATVFYVLAGAASLWLILILSSI